jgi:hypothetical protein
MRTKLLKVSATLTIAMLFLTTIVIGNAFGFGLKSLTGGKKNESLSVDSLVDKQANLVKRLYVALGDINLAQQHFAKALGNKEMLEAAQQLAKSIAEGNVQNSDAITEIASGTANLAEDQKLLFSKANEYDAAKKEELQKGLMPYTTGTVHSVLLGKEFMDQLNSTKDAIKQAGITGALSVKKKLAVTLDVAPNIPKLGSSLLTTANTAIKTAKEAKLNTAAAEDALGDLS